YPYTHKLICRRGSQPGRPALPSNARASSLYRLKSSLPTNSQIARAGCSSPINRPTSTRRQHSCPPSITSYRRLPITSSGVSSASPSPSLQITDPHPGNIPCSIPTPFPPHTLRFILSCYFLFPGSCSELQFSPIYYFSMRSWGFFLTTAEYRDPLFKTFPSLRPQRLCGATDHLQI